MPEAGARGGALDQPRDVGEHQLALAVVDRPEHRLEGRERVVGDLRRRPRQPRRAATTCPRSAARPGPRRRSASAAARSSPTRRRARARRTAAPAGSRWRSACCRARRRRPRRRRRAGPARPGRSAGPRGPRPGSRAAPGRPTSSPRAPWRCLPWPWPPRPARWCGEKRSVGEVAAGRVADEHDVAAAAAVAAVGAAARHVRLAAEGDARRCRRRPPRRGPWPGRAASATR